MSDIPITVVKVRLNMKYWKQEKYATCMPRIQVRSGSLWDTVDFSPKDLPGYTANGAEPLYHFSVTAQ